MFSRYNVHCVHHPILAWEHTNVCYLEGYLTQSTAEADGNVISFMPLGMWSRTKVLHKLKLWPEDGTKQKVRGSIKSVGFISWGPCGDISVWTNQPTRRFGHPLSPWLKWASHLLLCPFYFLNIRFLFLTTIRIPISKRSKHERGCL